MDQERAKELLQEGGTFVFLGVPQQTQFGIDMQVWNTDEDFRGIKMIPPGLHYIHYSAVNKDTGDISPRSGFMHYFHKQEFLVKMWDKKTEDISQDEITEESIQRLKDNLLSLDKHLAPYPFENERKWILLTSQISASLAKKLSPDNGIIRASMELMPMTDEQRPRGVAKSQEGSENQVEAEESKDDATAGQSEAKRPKRATQEEKEDAMLPNLKPVPGTAIRYTEIPRDKYPPGATPEEITKHSLDQSYTLELLIAKHDEPIHVIGEMQFAFLCFLIGHSLESFEQWKNLIFLLCSCEEAIHKHRTIIFHFIRTIDVQIEEMPPEFLADIVMNKNLVYRKLREFFRTAYAAKVDGRLMTMIERLQDNLSDNLQWDFSGLDVDEEDEMPVVVKLNQAEESTQ